MDLRHKDGASAEEFAVNYLKTQGFTIKDRNYRFSRYAEIDIIAYKDDLLLFVEVRSCSGNQFGGALASIRKNKLHRLNLCAQSFLQKHNTFYSKSTQIRFDLIAIDNGELVWHRDIIR